MSLASSRATAPLPSRVYRPPRTTACWPRRCDDPGRSSSARPTLLSSGWGHSRSTRCSARPSTRTTRPGTWVGAAVERRRRSPLGCSRSPTVRTAVAACATRQRSATWSASAHQPDGSPAAVRGTGGPPTAFSDRWAVTLETRPCSSPASPVPIVWPRCRSRRSRAGEPGRRRRSPACESGGATTPGRLGRRPRDPRGARRGPERRSKVWAARSSTPSPTSALLTRRGRSSRRSTSWLRRRARRSLRRAARRRLPPQRRPGSELTAAQLAWAWRDARTSSTTPRCC